jgi:hypothetical protein
MNGRGRGGPGFGDWWRASLRARSLLDVLRAWSPVVPLASAGLILGGCGEILSQEPDEPGGAALEDQRNLGWNIGAEGQSLALTGAQPLDVTGSTDWRQIMPNLAWNFLPSGARWTPYYAPALFQSLEAPRSAGLRFAMQPVFTPEMALAHRRGEALFSLLVENGVCRRDVALVLDLPGPESVALAAALAPCFDPVFVFDNWPHPRGVVPSQETLGAALYFYPSFERDRGTRLRAGGEAPPVFVLDRLRLAPYGDDPTLFDNRYFAALPAPDALQAAGIHHILYVTPDEHVTLESDDLNEDLVAIDEGGVDVKMLALSDFSETPLPGWPSDGACAQEPPEPVMTGPLVYFGGSPGAHACFRFWYGWEPPEPAPVPGGPSVVASSRPPPPGLFGRCHFRPHARATFGAAAAGHGQVWHAGSAAPGRAHGWSSGFFGFGRSGSLGRVHSGSWG